VNAVSKQEINPNVKHGALALGNFTALIVAAPAGGPEVIKALLDAGAQVDAADIRNMTALMTAIASDHANPHVIRVLLEHGADPKRKDRDGVSAFDWARKYNAPAVLRELGSQPEKIASARVIIPASLTGSRDAKSAMAKSTELLQSTGASFFKEGG